MSFLIAPSLINLKEISSTGFIASGMTQDAPTWPAGHDEDVATTNEVIIGAPDTNDYYTFNGLSLSGNNPDINLVRGQSYTFTNNMDKHPFRIQDNSANIYNTGIIGNNPLQNGTFYWTVANDTPDELFYQCTSHPSMGGKINVSGSGTIPDTISGEVIGYGPVVDGVSNPSGTVSWSIGKDSNIVQFNVIVTDNVVNTNDGSAEVIQLNWGFSQTTVAPFVYENDDDSFNLTAKLGTDPRTWSIITGLGGLSASSPGGPYMGPFDFRFEFPSESLLLIRNGQPWFTAKLG